jgi:periplasmic copper chaperone A
MIRSVLAAAVLAIAVAGAHAQGVSAGDLKISAAWSRATPKGAGVGSGYMKIMNTGHESDRLVGGSSEVAGRFEVHEMSMNNGVMKMRSLPNGLEIKPGQTVTLDPGGYHIMLVGLKKPLVQGEHFKATLEFAKVGKVDVDFTVQGIGARSGDGHSGMQHGH